MTRTSKFLSIVEIALQRVHSDEVTKVSLELGEHTLVILTGSHDDSAEQGTIELHLLKNGKFYKGDDDSIINYLPFYVFPTFMYCVSLAKCNESLEYVFEYYKKMYC